MKHLVVGIDWYEPKRPPRYRLGSIAPWRGWPQPVSRSSVWQGNLKTMSYGSAYRATFYWAMSTVSAVLAPPSAGLKGG